MLKIILVLWTLSPTGHIDRLVVDGWYTMEACEVAIDSFIAANPADQWQMQMAARCVEVPK